jgi:hypothetical protein
MLDHNGGVWSTLDADSDDGTGHKEEGAFYVWTPEQVESALGVQDGELACSRWTITKEGNFENSGSSVLALSDVEELSDEKEDEIRLTLLKNRAERARPGTDDKVLTSWNGMLLVALTELEGDLASEIGEHTAKGLLERSTNEDGSVLRTWRGEIDGGPGFLDDHAWAALGLLNWGIATDNETCIKRALSITKRLLKEFSDTDGGFWLSTSNHGELPIRQRCETDSAVPGSTSIVVRLLSNLLGIWPADEESDSWRTYAMDSISRLGEGLKQRGPAYWSLLNAAQDLLRPWAVWHIHHNGTEPEELKQLRRTAGDRQLVISTQSSSDGKDRGNASWMAWMCEGMSCKPQTTESSDLIW